MPADAAPSPGLPSSLEPRADVETLLAQVETSYVWSYENAARGLRDLYEKAKQSQWNASSDLAWETDVDPETELVPDEVNFLRDFDPVRRFGPKELAHYRHATVSWTISQFLHGEQGALLVASQLVSAVPWMDAKTYASTQTFDEARHVEVFDRYVHDKLEWRWPISTSLKSLFDTLIADSRWDFKYLGMQVIAEGTAMAAFANTERIAREPLLRDAVRRILGDEARHVAFGVLSLRSFYDDMCANELRDREDLIIEACGQLVARILPDDIARYMGFDVAKARAAALRSPVWQSFRHLMFSRVVPNISRLGLLTPRVRSAFEEMGVIQYEHAELGTEGKEQ